jgi:hypothetical protein
MKTASEQAKVDNAAAITAQKEIAKAGIETSQKGFEDSAKESMEQSRLDQRAWLGAVEMREPVDMAVGKVAKFGVLITNTGKTPAVNFTSQMVVRAFGRAEKFEAIYPQPPTGIHSNSVIQPAMKIELWSPIKRALLQSDIDSLKNGEYVLYIYGVLNYDDIFKRHHWTHFCMVLQPDDLKTENSCHSYNEVDQ